MKTILSALTLGLLLSAMPTSASAQDGPHQPFELGLSAGWRFFTANHGLGRIIDEPSGTSPKDFLTIGIRGGWNFSSYLGLEAEVFFVPTTTNNEFADLLVFTYRGQFIVHFIDSGVFRPFVLVGFGGVGSNSSDETVVEHDRDDAMLHGGIGAKFFTSDNFGIRIDGRIDAPPPAIGIKVGEESEFGGLDWEVFGGVFVAFGGEEPILDTDGDGFLDPDDKCPKDPEDKDGFEDMDGCPEPDNDQDGILDAQDKCPLDPEDTDGFEDEDGCPDPDNDQDQVLDVDDECPLEPEDRDGFEDENGCPDPDNDQDGILDVDDKCPDEPETKNGFLDVDGCPDEIPEEVKKFTGVVKGINFKTNSAAILKSSFKILDEAVKVLNTYEDVRVEISGHTDNRGKAEYNKDLSNRRADSVKEYLVEHQIDASRIETVGYGLERPIADNKTKAGRAQNRRIEFRILY